ncbi:MULTISPECIES: 5-dehydro-4-deoxyglucarate dehydratase [unclassified Actinopolyspora]|uniref:5-dehydro-4-deoxyglucarate dehydratase n=1 Tax=unclassified Actinopolyspora TaxID=2639451 RepID=UPI0013F64430|nr:MULTISPECIES: 5-dehydro-4-deoxyglucarate dehydratase [unclassified Actinopolyspora]NHD18700.1 5-dehydro-4-deoxyglucarate dehydratase [Actinopolyspora sp. BKK2]NHE77978.1 5-dehydro-4-deoxyglucarate dehydratase [Actinopolyspora sp. BKK1]
MTRCTPNQLAAQLGSGLLSFPVTHFRADLGFDEAQYRRHIDWLASFGPAGLFAAGGTGEFFSLTPSEVERVVATAVSAAPAELPVVAPAGYGTEMAAEMARSAERTGADGVLLFPPYLTECDQRGLAAHVRTVCAATELGVVVYNRANGVLDDVTLAELVEQCPNLVGFKDGVGNVDAMARIRARIGDRLTYVGGLPTAEMFALPYAELGVTTYSSAMFNFVPRYALDFYEAVRNRDAETVHGRIRDFVLPYCEIRDRRRGYAVSIVKAGMKAIGRPAGPVRPPLVDLDAEELDSLTRLVED